VNTRSISKPVMFGVCIAFAAGVALPAGAADAAAHPAAKSAHPHGGAWRQGGSHTRTTQTQRTANGHTSNTVVTDAQGRTATRDATVVNDKAAGSRTKDVTYVGRDGATRTADSVTQRTDSGYTRDTTYTDKNGNTATREADVEVDRAAGTKSRDVTYTGRDGEVRTVEDDRTRTDDGYQRTTVATGANGVQSTRNVDVSHDKDTQTTVKTVTVDRTPAAP
jgi:hypothetical protein